MLRSRRIGRTAGSIAVVATVTAVGGVVGGAVAFTWCSERGWLSVSLSPRRAATLMLAVATVVVLVLAALTWPHAAHGSTLGTAKNIGCGVAGLAGKWFGGIGGLITGAACGGSGGGGAADILSGLLHALPKLLPALLGGMLGWFVGSAAISHLLPGVLHLLVSSPVVLVGSGSQAGQFVTNVVLPVSEGALVSIVLGSAFWYWLVSVFSIDSGADALTALSRAGGAAFAVPVWLWGVPQLISASNLLSGGLVSQSGDAGSMLGALLGVGAGAGATGFLEKDLTGMKGFAIGILLIGVALVGFLLLLLALKVVVAATTVLLFIAFPLALTLYPLRKLEWLTEGILQSFVVVLLIPVGWALILATMGVVASTIGVTVHGTSVDVSAVGGWAGSLLAPMVALVLLWMLVSLPRQLIHLALLQTVSRRGFIGDVVHRTTVRATSDAARGYLPERWGGYERPALPAHETRLADVWRDNNGGGAAVRARDALAALDDPPGRGSRTPDAGTSGLTDRGGPEPGLAPGQLGDDGDGALRAHDGTARNGAAGDGATRNGTAGGGAGGDGPFSPGGNGAGRSSGSGRSRGPVRDMDGFAMTRVETAALERGIRQAGLTRQTNPPNSDHVARGMLSLPEPKREAVRRAHGRADTDAFTAQMVRQSLSSAHPRSEREVFSMLAAAGADERERGVREALRRLEQGEPGGEPSVASRGEPTRPAGGEQNGGPS
jgi:hypothetical protein